MTDDEKRVSYLQLLQEPIGRMSSTSSVFKGFSAAILAGLAAATITELSILALIVGLIPIISFCAMDIFYLRLERKLKFRYKQVVEGKIKKLDFKIDTTLKEKEMKEAKAGIGECIKSPSIWMFYGPIIGCGIALIVLKIIKLI